MQSLSVSGSVFCEISIGLIIQILDFSLTERDIIIRCSLTKPASVKKKHNASVVSSANNF